MSSQAESRVTIAQGPILPWETDEEAIAYANDPRAYILDRCKIFTSAITVDTNNILVATYFLPESVNIRGPGKTTVPFVIPQMVSNEAMWQGRVGLLLAMGPMAWVSDNKVDFGGTAHKIGEWLLYDRQDGRQIAVNRIHCRRLRDVDVWGATDDPYRVY